MTVIQPTSGWQIDWGELWSYRELLYFLVWRDVKIRYKQTILGVAWAVLQPLLTMVVFTLVFNRLAGIEPPGDVPYAIFAFIALLPWQFFSQAITRGGTSLVSNTGLVSKVYFPRLIIPLASVTTPVVDFALSFVILLGLMAYYGVGLSWTMLMLPVFVLLAWLTALTACLYLSPLHVRYRDVGHIVPFLVQMGLFLSPVAYPISKIPAKWLMLYSLNPMVGVIEGFRWALLGTESPALDVIGVSATAVVLFLAGGLYFFKRLERSFADII